MSQLGEFATDFAFYIKAGGWVMPPMVLITLLLWYGIGYRLSVLKRGSHDPVRLIVDHYRRQPDASAPGIVVEAARDGLRLQREAFGDLRKRLDDYFSEYHELLSRHSVMIRSAIGIAPLLGLLGTVVGMEETFDSLVDSALFSQTGGIAGGISQALITTQFGLAIAIPGLVINGWLDRRAEQMTVDLEQLKDVLCTSQTEGA